MYFFRRTSKDTYKISRYNASYDNFAKNHARRKNLLKIVCYFYTLMLQWFYFSKSKSTPCTYPVMWKCSLRAGEDREVYARAETKGIKGKQSKALLDIIYVKVTRVYYGNNSLPLESFRYREREHRVTKPIKINGLCPVPSLSISRIRARCIRVYFYI